VDQLSMDLSCCTTDKHFHDTSAIVLRGSMGMYIVMTLGVEQGIKAWAIATIG